MGGNRNYTDTQMHKNFCVSIWDSWEIVFTYTGTQIHRETEKFENSIFFIFAINKI